MRSVTLAAILLTTGLLPSGPALALGFNQTNLVSDVSGRALHTDANLVNPWGLVPGASGVFWSANNGTGNSTLYDPDGTVRSLVVTIPGGDPTGIVATTASDSSFRIPSADSTARALFIFVTQNGTVAAWNPNVNATNAIQVAATAGAQYTGAALGGTASEPRLYAANFGAGKIDVYNRDFALITLSGNFTDAGLPSGFSPFNIANIGGQLFVAYAQRDAATGDEVPGTGLGYVSVFNTSGQFLRRFVSGQPLNAPWAIVQAPSGFGNFGGSVLVGNFGDGRINAFNLSNGSFQGALRDTFGNPIELSGLWGLHFGLPVSGSAVAQRLYFAAGIEDETHGLFGYLSEARVAGEPVCDNDSRGLGFWRKQCGGPSHDDDHGLGNGNGNGNGNGHGKGKGNDKDKDKGKGKGHGNGHGDGDDDGHGHKPGVPSDSLETLLGCITSASSPNVFGTGGCFTAGCDLLRKVGKRTDREHAAQELLTVRLNLCAGLVCDSLLIGCTDEDEEDGVAILTVGEVADSLDEILCNGGSSATLRSLTRLLACVNGGEDEDNDDDGEDGDRGDSDKSVLVQKIDVKTIGVNPTRLGSSVQFAVSTTEPSNVQLRVYDALGRVVAEPMRNSMVYGSVQVNWDGKDIRGQSVAPGNYFFRATAGMQVSSGRIVIVR